MRDAFPVRITRAIGSGMLVGILVTTVTFSPGTSAAVQKHTSQRRALPKKFRVTTETIREAQRRLISLGYWIQESNGKWGVSSRHGLIAFQKVEGRPRTGKLTLDEFQALGAATRPSPLERGFAHIEVDLARQVLFIVEADGTVSRILPVSTGNGKPFTLYDYTQPAVTPPGRFRVYRKLSGWRKSPLGLLYYPNYIVGGIAIHGNPSVPARPASHGCIRIPMYASKEFSTMTPVGTQVIVHGESVHAQSSAPSH